MQTKKPIITVSNLNVVYFPGKSNEVHSLKNINLEIFPGEFICFFGPSGCGKSTLLYSISGLETKITGSIVINGKDLAKMNMPEREELHQSTIGMVFQAYYLIPSLNILQNVALPMMAVSGNKKDREARAQHLLDKFGVGVQAKKLSMELSGGQQQRVAICRSLMNNPSIIVADEPVGNLDTKSSKEVMVMLRDLNEKEGKTVILVTHDPSHLHNAHRVFYMRDGEIIETKVNSEAERQVSPVAAEAEKEMSLPISLQHWAKTYTPGALKTDVDVTAALKSQDILTETMTGLTLEELGLLELEVQKLLRTHTSDTDAIFRILHNPSRIGGLGMEKRKAEHLSVRISHLVKELEKLHKIEKKRMPKEKEPGRDLLEAQEIRHYLLHTMRISLKHAETGAAIDAIIVDRLYGKITHAEVEKQLTLPFRKGGVGFTKRRAMLFSRDLEPLIMEHHKEPEAPSEAKKEPAPAPAPVPILPAVPPRKKVIAATLSFLRRPLSLPNLRTLFSRKPRT